MGEPTTVYHTLDPESEDFAPIEIESLCTHCEENGLTKILLTKIPFYREVILSSFECPHCGNRNNELQPGAPAAEHGININLHALAAADLDREVVKSEYCAVSIPEVALEIPAKSQPGEITTVEGVIERVIRGVSQDQERRRTENPQTATQIDAFVTNLRSLLKLEKPFHLILDDPSGNSFVAPTDPTKADPHIIISHYPRTLDQRKQLGLADDDEVEVPSKEDDSTLEDDWQRDILKFQIQCYACGAEAENDMKIVDIPGFKETVVMGTNCPSCGYRSSEIKAASGISKQALRLSLSVECAEDLRRDVLKSETCHLSIPELELEGGRGVLSGVFTTVEGVVAGVIEELTTGGGSLLMGDSANPEEKSKMAAFIAKLEQAKSGTLPFTLVLDDPAGNSYIQSLDAMEADARLKKEWYDRTFEQNEDLGLNDMKTEDYTQESTESPSS